MTEWSPEGFQRVAEETYVIPDCELAPHDMALTDNYVFFHINSFELDRTAFVSGLKGPAESLSMNGRKSVRGYVMPRPTAKKQNPEMEPFEVEIPASFSIHFSHAYEDEVTGNLVMVFSGWPPSDTEDYLGAWGGFAPHFNEIPQTFLWRLEIDPKTKKTVDLSIAPGSANVCAEHCVVHPNFKTKKAQHVYAVASNVHGDSSAPCGYSHHQVETAKTQQMNPGERNTDIDCYFFGTRYTAGEPLVVPKHNGNPDNEKEAFLIGMVRDSVQDRSFVAVFDLERPLKEGPVSKLWLKSSIPHGLHGCFDPGSDARTSHFA